MGLLSAWRWAARRGGPREYRVTINPTQTNLQGYALTLANFAGDQIDNDGTNSAGLVSYTLNPGGSAAASSVFDNDYSVDFGFYMHYLSAQQLKINAVLSGSEVNIQWQTIAESNVNKYFIQRSTDGANFIDIATASSKGNGDFSYQGYDNINNISAGTVYYRIRTENINGSGRYSAIVPVNVRTVKLSVGPNPFSNAINIQINSTARGEANIRIFNAGGQMIYTITKSVDKGTNSFALNELQNFPKGLYVFEIQTNGIITRQKLMKQ